MEAYFRGTRVTIQEISGAHTWVQFPGSDNSRRVSNSELASADELIESVRDLLTDAEAICLASSLAIDGNVGRAFRMVWSRRLGYASHMSDQDWWALQSLAYRLGVDIPS